MPSTALGIWSPSLIDPVSFAGDLARMANSIETAFSYGANMPSGSIVTFAGAAAPAGWLLCNGAEVSRETFSNLFGVVGVRYGAGNGLTTFAVPDLRGKVPVGLSTDVEFNTLGKTFGAKTHTLTISEMPSHSHTIQTKQAGSFTANEVGKGDQSSGTGAQGTAAILPTGGGGAHNNIQPSLTLNFIIKA
jgi:microcystin-dependent protein